MDYLPVRILYDILFTPASLHYLILLSSIRVTTPSMVFRKSSFAFSIDISDLINVRRVLGGMTTSSITLSTMISASDILDYLYKISKTQLLLSSRINMQMSMVLV